MTNHKITEEKMNITGNKLAFFTRLFAEAEVAAAGEHEVLCRHMRQYRGSDEIDGSAERARVVRNITYELIESQVSCSIPTPSVVSGHASPAGEKNARAIETLLRNKRDELPFERLNDKDERYAPIYGGSVFLLEWDSTAATHDTVGDVRVTCLSPLCFFGQPGVGEVADMEYCFLRFPTTVSDVSRRYGVPAERLQSAESGDGSGLNADGTAMLYVCFYKNGAGRVCEYIWSGDAELCDLDDYYARKRNICRVCGGRKGVCTCFKPQFVPVTEEFEELEGDVVRSDGSVIPAVTGGLPTRIPYYVPTRLPVVIRKNTSGGDGVLGQSDCEFIRPQQQAINKLESRIAEKLLMGGVFPIVPEDFTGELDNSVLRRAFRAKQSNVKLFGKLDLQADTERDMKAADRLYDHAKRILGISDTYQGLGESTAESGKAKQILIDRAAGRLESKHRMKNAAYAEMDRILFEYYLAYADEPRTATRVAPDGERVNTVFSRYDFLRLDSAGAYFYDDAYLFSADESEDLSRSREAMWEQIRENFRDGVYGDTKSVEARVLFWKSMERCRFPHAKETLALLTAT